MRHPERHRRRRWFQPFVLAPGTPHWRAPRPASASIRERRCDGLRGECRPGPTAQPRSLRRRHRRPPSRRRRLIRRRTPPLSSRASRRTPRHEKHRFGAVIFGAREKYSVASSAAPVGARKGWSSGRVTQWGPTRTGATLERCEPPHATTSVRRRSAIDAAATPRKSSLPRSISAVRRVATPGCGVLASMWDGSARNGRTCTAFGPKRP